MRICITAVLFFISVTSSSQSSFLKEAAAKLDKALVTKDTTALKQVLHKNLTFGHSNGWVETRDDVLKDVASGKLAYIKINYSDENWINTKDVATMRATSNVQILSPEGKPTDLKLHVLLVWLKTNKGWQLLARQTTRLPQN
jgi:hypothetical protein